MNGPRLSTGTVVFFYRGLFPEGSHALRLRMLSKGLMAHGIQSEIIIAYPPPTMEDQTNLRANEIFALNPIKEEQGEFLKVLNKVRGSIRAYRILKARREGVRVVVQTGLGFLEGILVRRFCKENGVTFCIEANDINRWKVSEKRLTLLETLAKYQVELFDKCVLRDVDVALTVSSYLDGYYRKAFPRIRVKRICPALLDFEEYQVQSRAEILQPHKRRLVALTSNKVKFIYAGSCSETNGLKFFLRCAESVATRHHLDFEIILLFYVGQIDAMREYAKGLLIRERIHIIEKIPQHHIPAAYAMADILVLAEMGDLIAKAGFPSKIAEYMASGKAVLSTMFSDLGDYLRHEQNAMVAPIGDKKLYEKNLHRLLIDEPLRRRLGKNALETARDSFDYRSGVLPLVEELSSV